MKIAILGTGDAGTTLATGWSNTGHDVVLGSRTPGRANSSGLRTLSLVEACDFAEVVVNTIPGERTIDALGSIGSQRFKGKVLLDMSVGLSSDQSTLVYDKESGGEVLQKALPEAKVVKTLCTMTSTVMVNPAMLPHPTTVFLSGDDEGAKEVVKKLLASLGWPADSQLDLGGIQTARGQEHFALLYFALAQHFGHGNFNIAVHSASQT